MHSRRTLIGRSARLAALLATGGLLPLLPLQAQAAYNTAAFEAKSLAEAVNLLGGGAPAESQDVSLGCPDIAENGAIVPVSLATTRPDVRRLLLLVEKNPNLLSAMFECSDNVAADFATRLKLSQTSVVYAVAITADGKVLFAQKEVKVTLGGCAS